MARTKFNPNLDLEGPDIDVSSPVSRREIWQWFADNQDQVVAKVGFWIINFKVRVGDLMFLFEKLFGPPLV